MKCFVCKNDFNLKALFTHFKVYHYLSKQSCFECAEEDCNQSFSNIDSFRRHLKNKHVTRNIISELSNISAVRSSPRIHNCNESNEFITSISAEETNIEATILKEFSADLFFKAAAKFSVTLHNNAFKLKSFLQTKHFIIILNLKKLYALIIFQNQSNIHLQHEDCNHKIYLGK